MTARDTLIANIIAAQRQLDAARADRTLAAETFEATRNHEEIMRDALDDAHAALNKNLVGEARA